MLRVRLILWYSLLVVLTVAGVGLVQILIINRSVVEGLDNSLTEDAKITLSLVSSLPASSNPEEILRHGRMHSNGSLRDLVDRVLTEAPDTVTGAALTDRVISRLIDEILTELSFQDSSGVNIDPLDAIVQRNLSSKRNNFVEIHERPGARSKGTTGPVMFHSQNLAHDTLARLWKHDRAHDDSSIVIEQLDFQNEEYRVARAANARFVVYVAFPTTEVDDSLSRLRSSFLYLLPLAFLISALGGFWLARKALAPIEHIADMAREIGAKNLSQRIELPGMRDRELRVLTATLNSMFARLESSFEQVVRFTSDASHELKTPLAIMKGEIEQTQRHLELADKLEPAEARSVLESLMEEVERMQRIVEGLLLLSRADDRRLALEREPVVLYDFLSSLAEDGEILAEASGLELIKQLDDDCRGLTVSIDPTRFYQVVMNLLDNALKYTPTGAVTMFLHAEGERVICGISDTGMGIGASELPKIFERFYRTDAARSGPNEMGDRSLGLGLAIVRSIVEAHNGTIEVESEPGRGTTFTVKLPVILTRA